MYAAIRELLASVESARVFGDDKYDWYVYRGDKAVKVDFRGTRYSIEPKDKFGIRDATSSPGKYRLVLEKLGVSRVITPEIGFVDKLLRSSKPAK